MFPIVRLSVPRLSIVLLYLLLFLFIYGPPFSFLPINISLLVSILLLVYFFLPIQKKGFYFFRVELLLLMGLCFYSALISLLNGVFNPSNVLLHTPFIILFFNIPICFLIYRFFISSIPSRYESDPYLYLLVVLSNLAIFSSMLTLIFWLNPELGIYIKFDLMKYDAELMRYQSHRAFGLSDELLFSYSIVQASIFLLVFDKLGFSVRTYILMLSVIVSIGLNARIGFLVLAFILLIPSFWSMKSFLGILIFICSTLALFFWGQDGVAFIFDQFLYFVSDLLGSSDVSSSEYLLNNMLFTPDDVVSILLGSGGNIFGIDGGSDSGYVLLLFYGGVFYVSIIFILLSYILFRSFNTDYFVPVFVLVLVFLISNIKGLYFAPKPGMHLFIVVYVFIILIYKSNCSRVFK